MTDTRRKQPDAKDVEDANRKISRPGERSRKQAAAAKISPAMPAAGAAVLADVDPALDMESETKKSAERATRGGRDRMTGGD